jgi:hypothetical protein
MKNFTLAVYAKRRSDGNYDYSLRVWENRSMGNLSAAINFESRTLAGQQLDNAWPVRGDANLIGADIENTGDYWYRFTMPMSEEQAANLGWRSDSALDGSLVN